MLILLSPSKTLDYDSAIPAVSATQPRFLEQSTILIEQLRTLSQAQLKQLMGISDKLAALNSQRYQQFQTPFTPANSRPCIFAFKGDVYDGLDITQLDHTALMRTHEKVRILSGLYGLLRPFDLIQPYRLEMGTKLANNHGKNLYSYWGNRITDQLNIDLQSQADSTIINLASNEYFKAVKLKELNGTLITPHFKDYRGNQLKTIGLFAKKARGMMTHFLMAQPEATVATAQSFTDMGYQFDPDLSSKSEWIFTRRQ